MGHYDECREGYCGNCGQLEGYCEHTKHILEKETMSVVTEADTLDNEIENNTKVLLDNINKFLSSINTPEYTQEYYNKMRALRNNLEEFLCR